MVALENGTRKKQSYRTEVRGYENVILEMVSISAWSMYYDYVA